MTEPSTPRKLVVAALVAQRDRLLLTRRRPGGPLGGQWEFPGGKVEAGEGPEAALARELREEIGVEVEVGRVWDVLYYRYPTFELVMLVYHVRLLSNQRPRCIEVADLAWYRPAELGSVEILEADEPLLQRLRVEGLPSFASSLPPSPKTH